MCVRSNCDIRSLTREQKVVSFIKVEKRLKDLEWNTKKYLCQRPVTSFAKGTIANADCVRSRWWRCSRPPQSRPPWARPQTDRQVADRQPWRGYRAGSSTCNQQ